MRAILKRVMSEGGDLFLAVAVIGILLVLFTPIPTGLLDLLLLTIFQSVERGCITMPTMFCEESEPGLLPLAAAEHVGEVAAGQQPE